MTGCNRSLMTHRTTYMYMCTHKLMTGCNRSLMAGHTTMVVSQFIIIMPNHLMPNHLMPIWVSQVYHTSKYTTHNASKNLLVQRSSFRLWHEWLWQVSHAINGSPHDSDIQTDTHTHIQVHVAHCTLKRRRKPTRWIKYFSTLCASLPALCL